MYRGVDGKIIIWAVYRHDIKEITHVLSEKYGKDSVEAFYGDTADSEAKILLLASKIEKAIYDFSLAILEPEAMVLLSLLVILLFITAIVTI